MSDLVVISSPEFDDISGMFQVQKPIRVQAPIPKPAVKALGISILNRFPGSAEIQFHAFTKSHSSRCRPANSGPLSMVITAGRPRVSASLSMTTLAPPSEESTNNRAFTGIIINNS